MLVDLFLFVAKHSLGIRRWDYESGHAKEVSNAFDDLQQRQSSRYLKLYDKTESQLE